MNLLYSTGNEIVDEVSKINISGNIIPLSWFQTLVSESGKPMLLAIYLLADIVYWYRPKEIRDEESGNLVGYQKRFKADLLQRSYRQIENRFGVTKKQARTALNFLCEKGVIIKHLRDEKSAEGIMLHNNMYLELVPDKLKELTFPQINEGVSSKAPPYVLEGTTVSPVKADGDSQKVTTSTENTTNITTKDYINPIYTDMDVIEKMKIYEEIIKENIEYEYLIRDKKGFYKDTIDEIVRLMGEVVSIKHKDLSINGTKYPYELVKSQMLKLDSGHIRYVLESMEQNTGKIKNIKNYMITALYNARNTIDSYYRAEVNYDLNGGT